MSHDPYENQRIQQHQVRRDCATQVQSMVQRELDHVNPGARAADPYKARRLRSADHMSLVWNSQLK